MAKRTKQQSKEPTKKQIAVSRREKQQQMKVFIGLGILAALILVIALVAVADQFIIKPGRPVAVVNEVPVRTDEYQRRVLYQRLTLDTVLQNLRAQLALIDPEDPANGFLVQYYQQIESQASQQRLGVDRQTLDDMVNEELMRQEAAELGLTVSGDELDEAIRARIASMSGFLTETQATAVASTAAAVTATAESFTPTPEPTPTPTLATSTATTDAPTEIPEIPTPAPTPTRHIITDEEFSTDYADYLSLLKEQTGLGEVEYRQVIEAGLLAEKVFQYFADQVPTEAEQINVSHIQVDTEEEAQAVLERLDAGEGFALVATEVSTDTLTAASGGELGWFLEGELAPRLGLAVEEAALALNPGEYSQPISSGIGWHIVLVNERTVRPLTDFQLQTRQQQAYSDWLEEARNTEGVEITWEPDMAPPDPLFESSANFPAGGIPLGGTNQ
jgi:parvulin-like peptidyl-prolyl isomerase